MSTEHIPAPVAASLVCTRWRRYGHDRLYVTDHDGNRLGYRDLKSGEDIPADPADTTRVRDAAETWHATHDGHPGAAEAAANSLPAPSLAPAPSPVSETATTVPVSRVPEPVPVRSWTDLSLNVPGAAAREQALAKRAKAPVKTLLARVLQLHTDERAWRVGADGEELVAAQLAAVTKKDPCWTAIHAIPVGSRGSDIDHLVIGPGGVFTINTKTHPGADIWVGGDTFIVNGTKVPYVRNARHESERAARLLTAAVGRPVLVTGLIVPALTKAPLTIKSQPKDAVRVVARRDLAAWLFKTGPVLSVNDMTTIWQAARRSTTWEC